MSDQHEAEPPASAEPYVATATAEDASAPGTAFSSTWTSEIGRAHV